MTPETTMKHMLRNALFLAALVASASAPQFGQQTIVVDMAGGPGSEFTEIQPAIEAASPGDIILVRASVGSTPYAGFTVDKALRLVGEPGARVGPGGEWYAMGVEGLAAGEVVVLEGFQEDYVHPYAVGLVLQDNAGTVHCEDLEMLFFTLVDGTSQASFQDCTLVDVRVTNSQVLLSNTTARGFYDYNCNCKIPALDVESGSRVTVAGGTYTGPDEAPFVTGPDAAIFLEPDARLVVTGDFDTTIRAGQGTGAPAIRSTGGSIVIDPDPALIPSSGQVEIAGPASVSEVRIPYFHTHFEGRDLVLTVETWAEATVHLYTGPFVEPYPYGPTTPDIWVGSPKRLASGVASASGVFSRSFTMPNLKPGLSFPLQAVVVRDGEAFLSNPVVTVIAP